MEIKVGKYTVAITNPDKILFPDDKITKLELVEYYKNIAPIMLTHVEKRAITMLRYPNGIKQEGFYHKDAPEYFPPWIKTIEVEKSENGSTRYVVAHNEATLVYLANYGCLTPHIWLSRISKLENPDIMVFDLDPGKQDFAFICDVALRFKKLLEKAGLIPFVKTSGSKGLHVTIPLDRKNNFTAVRLIARAFAQKIAEDDPDNITLEVQIKKRKKRLFIDIARNAFGQTVVAPYAVRALKGAPVATPVLWNELSKLSSSQHYTIENIFRRLARKEDPWKNMYKHARSLAKAKKILDIA